MDLFRATIARQHVNLRCIGFTSCFTCICAFPFHLVQFHVINFTGGTGGIPLGCAAKRRALFGSGEQSEHHNILFLNNLHKKMWHVSALRTVRSSGNIMIIIMIMKILFGDLQDGFACSNWLLMLVYLHSYLHHDAAS